MTKRLPPPAPLIASLLALAAPALLAGCMGTQNRGLESVHQPVVARTDYVLDLLAPDGALAPGEGQRLAGWLESMRVRYGDRIALDDPAAAPRARDAVAAAAGRYGLLLADAAPVTAAPVVPGTVRVVVSRMRASVPGCPDWSRDVSTDFNQNTSSNQGCAINANLAAMVASPADLVQGRSGSGINDPAATYRSVDAYRRAAPSGAGGTAIKSESAGGK